MNLTMEGYCYSISLLLLENKSFFEVVSARVFFVCRKWFFTCLVCLNLNMKYERKMGSNTCLQRIYPASVTIFLYVFIIMFATLFLLEIMYSHIIVRRCLNSIKFSELEDQPVDERDCESKGGIGEVHQDTSWIPDGT